MSESDNETTPEAIDDEQLPEDLVPGDDNPLAEGLAPGESVDGLLTEGKQAEQSAGSEGDDSQDDDGAS